MVRVATTEVRRSYFQIAVVDGAKVGSTDGSTGFVAGAIVSNGLSVWLAGGGITKT